MLNKRMNTQVPKDKTSHILKIKKLYTYSTKPKVKVATTVKKANIFANVTHKNSSGANNWHTFIKIKSENSLEDRMDCSEEYTTPDIPPGPSDSGAKLNATGNPTVKFNNKNKKYKAKKRGKGIKPNDGPKLNSSIDKSSDQRKSPNKRKIKNENGVTHIIAIDCEMVGVEKGIKKDMLARVSLVNFHGKCIYDTFVKPEEPVLDYRTFVSGVRPEDLENAPDFFTVQKKVADILKNRILVGHGVKKDLSVLCLSHPYHFIRDTTKYYKITQGKPIKLKTLAQNYLGVTIQEGEHSSVQDALAAMQLYKLFRKDWEESIIKRKKKRHVKEKQVVNLQASVTQAMSLMDV